jgi:hypothetical protein
MVRWVRVPSFEAFASSEEFFSKGVSEYKIYRAGHVVFAIMVYAGRDLDAMLAPSKGSLKGVDEVDSFGVSGNCEIAVGHESFKIRFRKTKTIRFQMRIRVGEDKDWGMIGTDFSYSTFEELKGFLSLAYSHVEGDKITGALGSVYRSHNEASVFLNEDSFVFLADEEDCITFG